MQLQSGIFTLVRAKSFEKHQKVSVFEESTKIG